MAPTTFVLLHGGGASAWDWHLVAPLLHATGHRTVAVDLPVEDPSAGWTQYVDVVADAVGPDLRPLAVVGHSLGGFTAPLVADRLDAELIVLLAGMIPPRSRPGTRCSATTGCSSPRSRGRTRSHASASSRTSCRAGTTR